MGIEREVQRLGPLNRNVIVSSSWIPLDQTELERNDGFVRSVAETHFGDLLVAESLRIRSRDHFWDLDGIEPDRGTNASRAHFHMLEGLQDHVIYVAGQHPSDEVRVLADGTRMIEVAIYQIPRPARQHGARELVMQVGDVIEAIPVELGVGRVMAVVTGIFVERNQHDPFWNGMSQGILDPPPSELFPERDLPFVMFAEGDSIARSVGPTGAGLPATYTWIFFTDPNRVSALTAAEIGARARGLITEIERSVVRPHIIVGLAPVASLFQNKMLFLRIPMFLLAALAVSVVAYYLFLVSGLLARQRERDTVMLRSRGVSISQVFTMYALEGAVLVGIPILLAPFIAVGAVALAGYLPVYDAVSDGGPLPVQLTWRAWMWSAIAGSAAFLVMVAPALLASRRNIAEERASASRPDRPPMFQRYYLDVIALGLGGLVFWELNSRGTVVSGTRSGEVETDVTLLFAPAIFLIAVALIFLRVFPLAARLASWAAARYGSVALSVGFWRVARSPYWYSWPVLVLVLAGGLSVLAGTLGSTLQRSNEEQIFYETGADLRLRPSSVSGAISADSIQRVSAINGVELATTALRTNGRTGTTRSGPSFDLLAVDARDFPQVAWFREDFADRPIADMLREIEVTVEPDPIYIPEGTTQIGMWFKADPPVSDLFLWLILKDERDRSATITLRQIGPEWTFRSAPIPSNLQGSIELVSIQTFTQAGTDGGAPTTVYFDDLTVFGDGFEQVLVDFEEPGQWTPLPTSNGLDTMYSIVDAGPDGPNNRDGQVASLQLGRGTDNGVRGLYRTATGGPLPVLASETFLATTNTSVGHPFVASIGGGFVPLVIVDKLRYFPTLDQTNEPFLIANLNSFTSFITLRGLRTATPNEVYLKIDRSRHREIVPAVLGVFRSANYQNRQAMLNETLIDPLTVAGWRGMAVLSLVITALATVLGYLTYLAAHESRTRHDTAYLRAIGLSRWEFVRIVAIEHFVIGVLGIVIGVVAGLAVSRLAVSSLAHTATGRELLPPFILQTDWMPVVAVLGLAAATAAVVILGILRMYPRLPLHVLTRTSE